LLNLRQVTGLHLLGRAKQIFEAVLQERNAHLSSPGVVSFGNLSERIRRGKGKCYAGGGLAKLFAEASGHFAEKPAEQLSAELF